MVKNKYLKITKTDSITEDPQLHIFLLQCIFYYPFKYRNKSIRFFVTLRNFKHFGKKKKKKTFQLFKSQGNRIASLCEGTSNS